MSAFFSTTNSPTSETSGSAATRQRLYQGITFLALLTFAVGGAAAFLDLNHPGVTVTPHGVDPEAWENDPCKVLCTDSNLQAGIQYLAKHEHDGQFGEVAVGVFNYCLKTGCDVIGSVLEDCVKGIENSNEFLLAASAVGGAVIRGMRP